MKLIKATVLLFAVIILIMGVKVLKGQELLQVPSRNNALQVMDTDLEEVEQTIERWKSLSNVSLFLAIAVGVAGLITSTLQFPGKTWSRVTTAILGITVGTLTIIQTLAFPADRKTLDRACVQSKIIVYDMENIIETLKVEPNQDNQSTLRDEFRSKVKQFYELEVKLYGEGSISAPQDEVNMIQTDIISPAYAALKGPSWVSNPPVDERNYYFVGTGQSKVVREASGRSFRDAVRKAVKLVNDQISGGQKSQFKEINLYALEQYITKVAEPVSTTFEYEPLTGVYRYFTLLRVSKRLVDSTYISVFAPLAPRASGKDAVPSNSITAAGIRQKIQVKAPDLKDGNFLFTFTLARQESGLTVIRLDEIEVYEDGSVLGTGWFFVVKVDKTLAFYLPETSYTDSEKPTVYRMSSEEKAEATFQITPGLDIEISVTGYIPKDLKYMK